MSWIERRGPGFLVRERENGKVVSKGYRTTREQAEALKAEVDSPFNQMKRSPLMRLGIGIGDFLPDADNLADYLRQIIRSDTELRQASRETYEAGLRTHIEGTALGQTPINRITPQMLRDFWGALNGTAGIGARRNIHLLLSKAFTRAVLDGIINVSPLKRSGIKGPFRARTTGLRAPL